MNGSAITKKPSREFQSQKNPKETSDVQCAHSVPPKTEAQRKEQFSFTNKVLLPVSCRAREASSEWVS